jgi:hypothetical protein
MEPMAPILPLPERRADAPEGLAFAEMTADLPASERQEAAVEQFLLGNTPTAMRHLVPVVMSAGDINLTVWVTPDYVTIGSSDGALRVPLGLPAAAGLCRHTGCWLPTPRMVDAIYRQATLQLEPLPMTPSPEMTSNAYFAEHQRLVQAQIDAVAGGPRRWRSGELTAGHKKDLVLSRRLAERPGRVAIYGWHRSSGEPIQPLSTVHGAGYADYSHGVRLVWGQAQVDGAWRPLTELLGDPHTAGLLGDEGPLDAEVLLGMTE